MKIVGLAHSISTNFPKSRASSDSKSPSTARFLGRYPPPIQRRSSSLGSCPRHNPPAPVFSGRLRFGGPDNRPLRGYSKVPRFVPLEIRLIDAKLPCRRNGDQESKACLTIPTPARHFSAHSFNSHTAVRATSSDVPGLEFTDYTIKQRSVIRHVLGFLWPR